MTTPLEQVRALNYDHHIRMAQMRRDLTAQGVIEERDATDDTSYRTLLMDVPRDRRNILELGSSYGKQWRLLREWLTEDGDIYGIDLYEPYVLDAQKAGLAISCGYVEKMVMYPGESFDLVTSRHVMEHLGDLHAGMYEILRVTKPGGYITHVTPNMAVDHEPAHLNHRNTEGWREEWESVGLHILSVNRYPFHGGEVHIVGRKA